MTDSPNGMTAGGQAQQENELRVINALPDALLGLNKEGKICFANSAAEMLLGIPADKLAGQPFTALLPEYYVHLWRENVNGLLRGPSTVSLNPFRVPLRLDNTEAKEICVDILLKISSLTIASFLLSLREIKSTTSNNEPLLLQNQALKHELDTLKAEVTAANEEIEGFKFSLAHDLKSPLRIISGYTKIIEKKYENLLNDEAIELLDSIQEYSSRLNHLMSEMLLFSKLGKTELVFSTLDMTSIAQSALNEISTDLKHTASIRLNPLKSSKGDAFMMIKVFYHLLANAVKYSKKSDYPMIEISSFEEKGNVVYSIRDNGIGFDMKYEQMLYSLFYRLHDLKEFEGSGVGLAMVRRIIGRHGGKLWATSAPGKGATFYFSLPNTP